jgi:hypothetical protein
VRYGDDVLVVFRTRHKAEVGREGAVGFLKGLRLRVNMKGNVIVAAKEGLKYLGHEITGVVTEVDEKTTNRVLVRVKMGNLASYKALKLKKEVRRRLDYKVLTEVEGYLWLTF